MTDLNKQFTEFLIWLQNEKNYSRHTVSSYRRDLKLLENFLTQINQTLRHLNYKNCKSFIIYLSELNYSARSIHRIIAAIRSLWLYLSQRNVIDSNYWDSLPLPKTSSALPNVIQTKDMIHFLNSFTADTPESLRDRSICELLYATGMRISECTALDQEAIHLAEHEIRVLGKGNKERIVLFGSQAKFYLENYLQFARPKFKPKESALFLNKFGKRLSARSIQRMIKTQAKNCGLEASITPHTFRHSFASDLLNGGADLKSIQELLGHASLASTQIYTHISNEKLFTTFKQAHPRGDSE